MILTKKLLVKVTIVVAFITSFGLAGGPVFADEPVTTTTDNSVAATNGSDQSAGSGSATTTDGTPAPADSQPTDSTAPATDTPTTNSATNNNDGTPNNNQTSGNTTTPAPAACQPATNPSATPATDPSSSSGTTVDNNASIDNNICANAGTGNASVTNNANGGDATSGDASNMATIVNIISSLTGLSGAQLATFVQNWGDHFGDITIDPALLDYLNSSACGCGGNASINNNGTINNNINQSANSGNADVSDNGSGGNATTGDAMNVLNLINIINSLIAAQKSFIGIININGNLDGDILLPPDMLNNLGSSTGSSGGGPGQGGSSLDVDNNQGINNNINQTAASGNASVTGNGSGGNATTGNASNKLTLLNLTGSQIIGSNAILVIVNVLGQWFGMIVNAPAGATSAVLGDGTGTTCGCGGNLNVNNNAQINNNITQTAQTGNASVTGNGSGGNATSGNASNSANIINIINSDLSLNGWFGILIINVFGTWTGSFGIDTPAGNPPASGSGDGGQGGGNNVVEAISTSNGSGSHFNGYGAGNSQSSDDSNSNQNQKVLGTWSGGNGNQPLQPESKLPNMIVGGIASLCCFLLLSLVERRRNHKSQLAMPTEVVAPAFSLGDYQQ